MIRPLHRVVLALALWPSAAGAATLVVDAGGGGGAFTTLQAALNAAQPNDVIWVKGGSYANVTVAKPVTIVAEPAATILPQTVAASSMHHQEAAVTLAGSGSGAVRFTNVTIGGTVDASFFGSWEAGITGGGFGSLALHRCVVKGPVPFFPTGGGSGRAAIDVGVGALWITNCTITGGSNTNDFCSAQFFANGAPGVRTTGSVTILDSTVVGGAASDAYYCAGGPNPLPPQPCPCTEFAGIGGPGVVAPTAFVSGSSVAGGEGLEVVNVDAGGAPYGQQPSGPPFQVSALFALPADLASSGPPRLGQPWSMSWLTSGQSNLALFGAGPGAPLKAGSAGWFFLNPLPALLATALPNGANSLNTTVPNQAALIGLPVGLQVYDPTSGLTRPLFEIVRP